MPSMIQNTEQRQQHTLSPRLQHAVRLLQLSSLDFAQELNGMLATNPFLESEDIDAMLAADEEGQETEAMTTHDESPLEPEQLFAEQDPGAPRLDAEFDRLQQDDAAGMDSERELWQSDGAGAAQAQAHEGSGQDASALDFMASHLSLAAHLHTQIDVLPLPTRDRVLAKALIESLDEDGYLRFELAELGELVALEPAAQPTELQVALRRVQALEPTGVAARSVAECLTLQLPAIGDETERALAARIVNEQLDRLAARDTHGLARALGSSPAVVERACKAIRRLDPRPGWRFSHTHAPYVHPDVIVKKVQGRWTVLLNQAVVPRLRLNRVYAELFQRHRQAQDGELAGHLQEARWAVSNVEQRFATILSVAQAIVRHQQRFFDFGPMAMRPLGLRAIADEVGLHESTVSRVTNNKYMATPLGVFELKHFFSRALATANGKQVSGTAIRGLIKEMIEEESPHAPLSDPEIARRLERQGLLVARRTVTKYRQCLGLEAVDRRARKASVASAGAK
ncbi:MAG: RNA polymerase factor sigma-54 [Burkholderiaceae bacterium]